MNNVVLYKTFSPPPVCYKEILRYAGVKDANTATEKLLELMLKEAERKLSYKVCYCEVALHIDGDVCNFNGILLKSRNLSENLSGCNSAIIFAATVGVEIDRLIIKYSKVSPSKSLMLQAIGTERIEALCDTFCKEIETERGVQLTPRFSPGYGDLSVECQRDIFNLIDCQKRIGLTLNSSLFMSPTKSVTAIVGINRKNDFQEFNKCSNCDKLDCNFRGVV